MNTAVQALAVFLPVAYLVVAVFYGMAFAGDSEPGVAKSRGKIAVAIVCLHTLFFVLHGAASDSLPLANTWMMISSIVLGTCILFLLLSGRLHQPTVGCFLFTLAALLQLLVSAFGPMTVEAAGRGFGTAQLVHALTSISAASALLLSGIYGWLHLMLYRQMRAKRFGPLYRELPDLAKLSLMTRRSALAGFAMMTLGVNVGIGWGHATREGGFSYLDAHVVLTLFVWLHFGAIAISGKIPGFSGRRASIGAVTGMVTLLALLFLSLIPGLTDHAKAL